MDLESPPQANFEIFPECLSIDKIVLCHSSVAANVFLTNIYPSISDCVVISADRVFPTNSELRRLAAHQVLTNPKVIIAVFGIEALRELKPKSERLLIFDELIANDFRRNSLDRFSGLELNSSKIVFLLKCFFGQWDRIERIGRPSLAYREFAEFKSELFDWKHDLIAGRDTENNLTGPSK